MAFIPVIALCTALSGEPNMSQCVFVDDQTYAFQTETGCAIRATDMKDNVSVRQSAANQLYQQYGYVGPQGFSLWCIEERNLRDFYQKMGVGGLEDIPHDA